MGLLNLGMFTFAVDTALYDSLAEKYEWRHPQTERFGDRPASQFTGPGNDTVTIAGSIVPGVAGSHEQFRILRAIADTGDTHSLVDGEGRVHGHFVILSIDQRKSHFIDNGGARKAEFTIELQRVV